MTTVWLTLKALLSTFTGRAIAVALLAFGALQVNNQIVRTKAVERVVTKSKKVAKKRNAKAAKIRRKARRPGAAERLLRDACRDC